MARQETIKILRSDVPDATPSLTAGEIAVNIADRKFFVGGVGGTSDRVTFRDELSTAWSVNGLTGNITLTGDGGSLVGAGNTQFTNRLATTGVTGVASFLSDHFTVSETGHVSSRGVITINNTAPDENGNFTVASATVVTGDGGALRGDGAAIIARLATTSVTGVASFNSTHFSVSSGAVSLSNSSVSFRGSQNETDTISLGNTLTLTGGLGITVRKVGTDSFAVQGATAGVTAVGMASFNPSYFTVSNGSVALQDGYAVTGDTVVTVGGSGVFVAESGKT